MSHKQCVIVNAMGFGTWRSQSGHVHGSFIIPTIMKAPVTPSRRYILTTTTTIIPTDEEVQEQFRRDLTAYEQLTLREERERGQLEELANKILAQREKGE